MFNYLKKHNMRNSLKTLLCLTAICVFSNNAAARICFLPDGDCGKTKININSGKNGCIYKSEKEANTGKNDECEVSYQSQVNSCWWRRCNSDNKTIFDKLADCQKKIEDATSQKCQACGSCYKLVTIPIPPNACPDGYSTKYQSLNDCGDNESFSENGTYNGKVCGACTKTETCPSGYSTQYQSQSDCKSGETFSSSGSVGNLTCGKCETTNKTCKEINPNYYNIDDANNGKYECNLTGNILYSLMETGDTGTDGACYECRYVTCNEYDSEWGTYMMKCPSGYIPTPPHGSDYPEYGSDGQCFQCQEDTTTCSDIHSWLISADEKCKEGYGKILSSYTTPNGQQCYECREVSIDIDTEYCPFDTSLGIAYKNENGEIIQKQFDIYTKKTPKISVPYNKEYFVVFGSSFSGTSLYQLDFNDGSGTGNYCYCPDNSCLSAIYNKYHNCKRIETSDGGHLEYQNEVLYFSNAAGGALYTTVEPTTDATYGSLVFKPYCQNAGDINMNMRPCAYGPKGGGTICQEYWSDSY